MLDELERVGHLPERLGMPKQKKASLGERLVESANKAARHLGPEIDRDVLTEYDVVAR